MQNVTPFLHPAIILDTDAGPDGDDTAALSMLINYANEGKIDFLAAVCNTSSPYGASYLRALCLYYGHPEIKIGTMKSKSDIMPTSRGNIMNVRVTARYYTDIPDGLHAPCAVDVYREALANAEDGSVSIVSIGMQTNIADLLLSKPDKYSELDGVELVRRKVRLISAMAGKWPKGDAEFNIYNDIEAARTVAELCPIPIVYSGFTVGEGVKSGPNLDTIEPDSPLRVAWWRMDSWDQTSVIAAVEGIDEFWSARRGIASIDEKGNTDFIESSDGLRYYLIEDENLDSVIAEKIDALANAPKKNCTGLPNVASVSAEDTEYSDGWEIVTRADRTGRENFSKDELKKIYALNYTHLVAKKAGERLWFKFHGTKILVYGARGTDLEGFDVYIDGQYQWKVNCSSKIEPDYSSQLLCCIDGLDEKTHLFELVTKGRVSIDFMKSVSDLQCYGG